MSGLSGDCCQFGTFDKPHACAKGQGSPLLVLCTACGKQRTIGKVHTCDSLFTMQIDGQTEIPDQRPSANGAGIERSKLHQSTGRPKGARNLHAKHPSSMARKFRKAGLDWQTDLALAIKANKRERIKLWLRLLPYLVTTTNKIKVKKWTGKASRAAVVALDALEGR